MSGTSDYAQQVEREQAVERLASEIRAELKKSEGREISMATAKIMAKRRLSQNN